MQGFVHLPLKRSSLHARPAQVNYWPSKVENTAEVAQPQYEKTFMSKEPISGHRVKEDLFVGDDYVQAGDRIRSMDQGRCGGFLGSIRFG